MDSGTVGRALDVTRLRHEALFFGDDDAFIDAALPFITGGLQRGDAVACAITRSHEEELRRALGADAERVRFFEDDGWLLRPPRTIAGWHEILRANEANNVSCTRALYEPTVAGAGERRTTWTRLESAFNRAFENAPLWMVCLYDIRKHSRQVLDDARRTHPIIWNEHHERSPDYVDPSTLLSARPEPMPVLSGPPTVEREFGTTLDEVRELARRSARQAHLSRQRAEDLTLAVNEVATNCLRHGRGTKHLAMWVVPDEVICEISDQGSGPADPAAGYVPPSRDAERGMGLWVVGQLSDAMAISSTDDGTAVRFAIRN